MGTVAVLEKSMGLDKAVSNMQHERVYLMSTLVVLLLQYLTVLCATGVALARAVGGGFRPGDPRAAAVGLRGGPVPRRRV